MVGEPIRLMADYECFPLWGKGESGNLDPAALPISAALVAELMHWAAEFDATLVRDDPARSGFPTPAAEAAFYDAGEALARRLATELGRDRLVTYFDGRIGRAYAVSAR